MKERTNRDIWRTFVRAVTMVWQAGPLLTLVQAVFSTLQALLPLITLIALKRAIDIATLLAAERVQKVGGSGAWQGVLHDPYARAILLWLVVGACAIGIQACLGAVASWVAEQHAMAVSDLVHEQLHGKLQEVDLAFFEDSSEQDRLHFVQDQAMTQPVRTLGSLFQLLHATVALTGVMALLATLHAIVPLVVVISGIPMLIVRVKRSQRLFQWRQELAPLEREASYYHFLLCDGDFAREMRMYGHGGFCRESFAAVRLKLRQARLAWRRYLLSRELMLQAVMLTLLGVVLLWLTGKLLYGAITLGTLVMAVQAAQRGQGQVSSLAVALADIYHSALFYQSFERFLQLSPEVTTTGVLSVPPTVVKEISFENVSFNYPGTKRMILQDLSFDMKAGEKLALVGRNGAGKSTIVKLLCRLYDPSQGRILVNGVDLRTFDPLAWRREIGVMFQDFGRYQMTAAENIWIGDPQGSASDARIERAASLAELNLTLDTWPDKLDTQLGRWLKPGIEPSVGEWQRIALARVLLRQPAMLILDEPTSALDQQAQYDIAHLLQQRTDQYTTLVVTHRREMLEWVDRILVLQSGSVMVEGTPAQLLQADSNLTHLFTADDIGGKN